MQHSKNESKIPIPPNVLKNFNVYDILEPQKSTAKTSDGAKVDKLIDIDDCSKDSGVESLDLSASFFDKKKDFDLVDLFQNIFVTPQHIKQKETESNEIDGASNFSASNHVDAGFDQFFDMLESGEKIDWTNLGQSKKETISKYDFIEETPKVLVPKVFEEPDTDPEDLIDEVLTQKTLEKLGSTSYMPKLKSDSPKKKENVPTDVTTDFSRFNLNNSFNNSKFESGSNEFKPRPEPKPSPVNSQISNSLSTFTVLSIQKDEKAYKKKRLQKPDHLKATYTKGPDFYEKSVVLPQIMARLTARLDYLEEIANQKYRLILDGGAPKAECGTSKREETKTKTSYTGSTSSLNPQTKIPNVPSTSGISFLKTPKTPNIPSTSGIRSLKTPIVLKDPSPCNIRRSYTTVKPVGCSSQSTSDNSEFGKLSPKVLMEDCNKERLKALKQSQKFIEFVLDGKHIP